MKLLAWDTSSKAGAIVALEWSVESPLGWAGVRQAGEWSLNVDSQHSERLLWGVHQMLEAARWRLDEVDLFAVGIGPGSFTGLRIGITTARTLAHTLQKPLIGVSSLAALARPAALWLRDTRRPEVKVIASIDACKGELFALWGKAGSVAECAAVPEGEVSGLWKRDVREGVVTPQDLMSALGKQLNRKPAKSGAQKTAAKASSRKDIGAPLWLAVGEGRKRYIEAWQQLPARQELKLEVPFADQVQGRYLGMLAWEAWQARLMRPALEIHPRYVRASDAEIKLKSGLLRQAPEQVPAALLAAIQEKA